MHLRRPTTSHASRAGFCGRVPRPVCLRKKASSWVSIESPNTAARNARHAVHDSVSGKAAPRRFGSARASRMVTTVKSWGFGRRRDSASPPRAAPAMQSP